MQKTGVVNKLVMLVPEIHREKVGFIFGTLFLLLIGLWNLSAPPPWWDEGWTLSVARNLTERGLYGRLLDGQPAPPGLEASFVVTGPVSIIMRIFGVGLWQGRIFGVCCTVTAIILIWWLTDRLYNRPIAIGAVAAALLLSMHPQLHILIQGRQVLGEAPMFAYLLAGYACLLLALQRQAAWVVPALLCFALARLAKSQAWPFLSVALVLPLVAAVFMRRWRIAAIFVVALSGSFFVAQQMSSLFWLMMGSAVVPGWMESQGLLDVTGIVLRGFNRQYALLTALTFGLPTLLGLLYGAWSFVRRPATWMDDASTGMLRLSLLALAGGWFGWYLLLSVGVPRYMFPPVFLGSIFVSAFLYVITGHFSFAYSLRQSIAAISLRSRNRQSFGALLALLLISASLPLTALAIQRFYFADDDSAARVAHFFNTQTPADTLIETYESELHFMLDQPYHYPPDQIHVELNRRGLLHEDIAIDYDPMAADPDYLVVGVFGRGNDLYKPTIQSGAFALSFTDGDYEVYERVRK